VGAQRKAADVFVPPSFAVGVPESLTEAMVAALPAIGPLVAGVPELIEDGVSGYAVFPGNIAQLRDRLDGLLSESALRTRPGAAG